LGLALVHALDFLKPKSRTTAEPFNVVYGDESFLRRLVRQRLREQILGKSDEQFSLDRFEGPSAELREVKAALATRGLFSSGPRLVEVDAADGFVSEHRSALEALVEQPSASGVLVLFVDSFPSNTKLFKKVAERGLAVECAAPREPRLLTWLEEWSTQAHSKALPPDAAARLLELIGPELGLLDQELAKLSALAGDLPAISAELVEEAVGGWRTRTVWEMLDAAAAGTAPTALAQLDRLLSGGENPVGVLAQISGSLRRYAATARLIVQAEAAGRRLPVRQALEEAGVKPFVLAKSEAQLRQLGRARALQLDRWLVQADLDLKGDSPLPPRVILEQLLVRMAQRPAESAS